MPLSLGELKPSAHRAKPGRRLGRGSSSTKGNYSGKGIKGQKARQGGRKGLKRFGQKRIIEGLPKMRGFKSKYDKPQTVNVSDFAQISDAIITPAILVKHGFVKSATRPVKVLGDGELKRAVKIQGCMVSAPARAKIEAAGGSVAA